MTPASGATTASPSASETPAQDSTAAASNSPTRAATEDDQISPDSMLEATTPAGEATAPDPSPIDGAGGSGPADSAESVGAGGTTPGDPATGGASAGAAGTGAEGGAGGDAGGFGGSAAARAGGVGGADDGSVIQDPLCDEVEAEYARQLALQRTCNPQAAGQCEDFINVAPGCQCEVFITPKDPFAIENMLNLMQDWFGLDCSVECPDDCVDGARAQCQVDGSSELGGMCVTQ